MKLVDVLARDLKVWPEGECFAWQDYDREVRFSDSTRHDFFACSMAEDNIRYPFYADPKSGVTQAQWQAAVYALNAPKVVDWDEFGFPPAGVSCEFTSNDGYNWKPCRILYADELSILTGELEGKADRRLLRKCDADVKFRPARTAEQVAAEEREKARTEVLNAMTANGKTANEPEALWQFRLKVVGEMLDMGYRKDTKLCGS